MSDLPLPEPVAPEQVLDQVLDIQHDPEPAQETPPSRHIPHLGHTLLFFSLAWFFLSLFVLLFFAIAHVRTEDAAHDHPGLGLLAQAASYALTLAVSIRLFPRFWEWPFVQGIQWKSRAVRPRWYWLVPAGVALSAAAQGAMHFFPPVKEAQMEHLMSTTWGAWWTMAFGVLLAPLVEEIAFRGFLLPSLATAYDWLLLERKPAALQRWQSSATHSRPALAFAVIFSSVPFALLHAGQLSHAWGAVAILYSVSLVLSLLRLATRSVACSTLVHATYNFSIFIAVCIATGGFRHLDKIR